jgi:predicted dehydrogenase
LVEKPITTTLAEARQLADMAKARSLSLSVNLMMPQNAYNRLAREIITRGMIGEVDHAVLHMEFLYGATPDEAASWRCSDPSQLGGPIADVGGHCLDMAEFLAGSPICAVSCVTYPDTLGIAVENGAYIQYRTESGKTGTIRVAFSERRGGLVGTLGNLGYEVYGSGGSLHAMGTLFQLSGHPDEPYRMQLFTETERGVMHHTPEHIRNIYRSQILEHAASIRDARPMDGARAVHNLALILACHQSAACGGEFVETCDVETCDNYAI